MRAADVGTMEHLDWVRLAFSAMANDANVEKVVTVTALRHLKHQGCPDEALTEAQERHLNSSPGSDPYWGLGYYSNHTLDEPAA